MTEPVFQQSQAEFMAHVRDPDKNLAPQKIEDRRMGIYRDLIYNNIEGFISGGFPILRKIIDDQKWHRMVRDFICTHEAHTPYFIEIAQEFLTYLQNSRNDSTDPGFMLELAHYEWVELALDVSTDTFPVMDNIIAPNLLDVHPVVSPLAWNLSYQYPVHKIGPDYQPQSPPGEVTFLVVYRNKDDVVKFMESNAATSRLLTLLSSDSSLSGREALVLLAEEMKAPNQDAIIAFGEDLLTRLLSLDIICGVTAISP